MISQVWFLATCHRCGPDLAQPFFDDIARDGWAVKHAESTGHLVHLSVDGPAGPHSTALLRFFAHGSAWRWACPFCAAGAGSVAWNGPFDTGQLALACWRAHAHRLAPEVTA